MTSFGQSPYIYKSPYRNGPPNDVGTINVSATHGNFDTLHISDPLQTDQICTQSLVVKGTSVLNGIVTMGTDSSGLDGFNATDTSTKALNVLGNSTFSETISAKNIESTETMSTPALNATGSVTTTLLTAGLVNATAVNVTDINVTGKQISSVTLCASSQTFDTDNKMLSQIYLVGNVTTPITIRFSYSGASANELYYIFWNESGTLGKIEFESKNGTVLSFNHVRPTNTSSSPNDDLADGGFIATLSPSNQDWSIMNISGVYP